MSFEFSRKTRDEALKRDGRCIIHLKFPRTGDDNFPTPKNFYELGGTEFHHIFYRSSHKFQDLNGLWNCAPISNFYHRILHNDPVWGVRIRKWLEEVALKRK
jgi:hypothetical protein